MSDEIDHIAELQKRLYARDPDAMPKRKFGILRPVKQVVNSTWGQTELPKDTGIKRGQMTGVKRFFIFSLVFFLIALSLALFSIYRGALTLSSKNVDVRILGNSFVGGGEDLPVQIEVANKNSADLIEATLLVDYPKGAVDQSGSDVMRVEKVIGSVPSGKTKSEAISVVLYGEQGAIRTITAKLTYKLAGSSSVFQKSATFPVTISSSPIALTVDGPVAVASNQPFEITFRNLFKGESILKKTVIRAEYPNGFVFQSANPAPLSGNNVWSLGDLEQGVERTISVKGKIVGEEGDEKSFRIYVGTPESDTDNKIGVTYNSVLHKVTLSRPFLSAQIIASGESPSAPSGGVIALPIGSAIKGVVSWANNALNTIVNPTFVVTLDGNIDHTSVNAGDGRYDSLTQTITWSGDSNPTIASLASRATGQLPFSFSSKSGDLGDITMTLSIAGSIPEGGVAEQSINSIDSRIVRFVSRIQFAVASLYSVGAIKNTGPMQPKVDQESTYTITWTARPSEHALATAQAQAMLPEGVVWTGVISPQAEQVIYNPDTRIVTWNIGNIPKMTNVPQSKIVSFQVKIRPIKAQTGSEIELLGDTTITATDTVANVPVTITRPSVSTSLYSDPAYSPGKERVLP